MTANSRPPWADLPPNLSTLLRPHVEAVAQAIIEALPREVPPYSRPLEGRFGEGLRQGVRVALARFADLPGTDVPALAPAEREVYVGLGRGELRQGRELQTLLAAYRVGARVAFRRFAGLVDSANVGSDVLIGVAEAVFAYIDELSAASVEGYAYEQSRQAGESSRRRSQLLQLLVLPPVDEGAARLAAPLAGWTLPEELVAVVVPREHTDGLSLALGIDALVDEIAQEVVALIPAPRSARARARLDRMLQGRGAAIGPTRPWPQAGVSLLLARATLRTLMNGSQPVHSGDHLVPLLLHDSAVRTDLLARLGPLDDLDAARRERLAQTLLSWLRHRGERVHIAAELHVHTQTVGYRLGQLRELFGDELEDPQARLELQLALLADRAS